MLITKDSHLDHNLNVGQLDFIKKKFADRKEFFIETFELPEELGTVEVSLIGPATGGTPVTEDQVCYRIRGDRKWASRAHEHSESVLRETYGISGIPDGSQWWDEMTDTVKRLCIEAPKSRLVTVIAGPHTACPAGGACTGATCADYDSHVEHACVLYTAYGGPQAPREPGDPSIKSWEELVASREFWSQHALLV